MKRISVFIFIFFAAAISSFSKDQAKDPDQKKPGKFFKWIKKKKKDVKKEDFKEPKHREQVYEKKVFRVFKRKKG
jgi:hypothetical protein